MLLLSAYSAAACKSPCFGWRCATTTIVAPLVLLGFSFPSNFHNSASDFRSALVIGLVYGLASTWCWTLTLTERKIVRFLIGLAIVTLLSLFAATTFERSLLRYWVNMAGMVLVQSVVFWLIQMPRWRTSRHVDTASKQQFQILDILLVTTGLAALLTIARQYRTPVQSDHYWQVMVGVWIWLPVLASTVYFSIVDPRWISRVCALAASVALTLGGAFALAALDQRLGNQDPRRAVALYSMIALAFSATWWTFGWSARQDANAESRFRQEVAPASES